ncbi:MAG: hypothetical protein AABX17_01555 [Nanoarchaeota archaeon]
MKTLTKILTIGTGILALGLAGCSKNEINSLQKYSPWNAPRAHTIVGEDIVDADGDGVIDIIVKSTEKKDLRYVVFYREGFDKKAEELGYVLTKQTKSINNMSKTYVNAQMLFDASQHYKAVRENASKGETQDEPAKEKAKQLPNINYINPQIFQLETQAGAQ